MLTDATPIVRNLKPLPALVCAQRKAEKRISTDEDFIRSNLASFGNEIGQTTNWITSMFEVRSHFDESSKEYEMLSYRIRCGQLYQQNAIDKAKGIIAKPMPAEWHDRHAVAKIADEEKREFYYNIAATRKPYFMQYIYPSLRKDYNTYINNTMRNCLREFQLTVEELMAVPDEEKTERQREFLYYYNNRMPVGTGDCVMNKICRRFEEEFDGCVGRHNKSTEFDYTIMKGDAEYTPKQFSAVKNIYDDYRKRLNSYAILASAEKTDRYDANAALFDMMMEFRRECDLVCPNEERLCNILLDLCYKKSSTKRFVWSVCGSQIIKNMLLRNGNRITFPTMDDNGDIVYEGNRYREDFKEVGLADDNTE